MKNLLIIMCPCMRGNFSTYMKILLKMAFSGWIERIQCKMVHTGHRFPILVCGSGVDMAEGVSKSNTTLAGRFSKNRRGCARFAFIDRRVVSGGHPLRCATNANYPLRRLTPEEGLVRSRLSGRSPGISEDLVSVEKISIKIPRKILKIMEKKEGKKAEKGGKSGERKENSTSCV